jgi:hypothetical protein
MKTLKKIALFAVIAISCSSCIYYGPGYHHHHHWHHHYYR